jgi:hypothetical protein
MHNAWIFPPTFFIEYFSLQISAKIMSLMSLITVNKVKKNTQAKVLWKRKGQSQQKNFEKIKLR